MERENRYLVFKFKDVDAALSEAEREGLLQLFGKVLAYRLASHKPVLESIVIENDWPEYELAWKAIEKRMSNETNQESKTYTCGVNNCGNGNCVHQLLDERCPHCKHRLVEVTTTGFKFCSRGSGSIYGCDYEETPTNPKAPA